MKAEVIETKKVPIKSLKMFHKNPRVGDVDTIAISLNENGQYKPIIVNKGTKTGRKNEILAGNHTYLGARKELTYADSDGKPVTKKPMTHLLVSFVDVDDETAAKIVLVDNRAADKGSYDDRYLGELLESLDDITGSGFLDVDVEEILERVERMSEDVDEELDRMVSEQERQEEDEAEEERRKTFEGAPLGEEGDYVHDDPITPEKMKKGVEDQSEELAGMFQFKPPESLVFEGSGYFGIPKLRQDMLMTFDDIPAGLDSWAGSATKDDDDPDRWWLWNWGIDSTSGMKDISKVIVSFYCYDDYFDNFWYYPERYFAKIINSNIKFMLTPNWSQATELPHVESLWALYRARWIGRYAQECGLKVCPDITWRDGDLEWLEKYVLSTLPIGLPLIAMQLQTIDEKEVTGGMKHFKKQIETVLDTLEPEGVLLYTGRQGRDIFEPIRKRVNKDIRVRYIDTRMSKLSEQAKKREKKTTI